MSESTIDSILITISLRYKLTEDDVVLGSEGYDNLVDDLVANYEVKFTPGGATQNAIRVAQWVLTKPGSTTYVGSVGRDLFAKLMRDAIRTEGVTDHYIEIEEKPTGKCVVLITSEGLYRSLVSFPGAARSMTMDKVPWDAVERAKMVYTGGFVIATRFDIVLELAKHCNQYGKLFCFNLAAKYVPERQIEKLKQLLPLADILFGNDGEIQSLADQMGWKGEVEEIMRKTVSLGVEGKDRCIVITRGKDPILVTGTGEGEVHRFPVTEIPVDEIVDTNCAGDAFVGGFLGYLAQYWITEQEDWDHPVLVADNVSLLTRCVKEGIFCSRQIIRASGCSLDRLWELSGRGSAHLH